MLAALLMAGGALAADCRGTDTVDAQDRAAMPFYGAFAPAPSAADLSALGRALFFDTALSASSHLACASCHDPAHAYGPPGERPVEFGGGDGRRAGVRAVPSLKYAQNIPPFALQPVEDEDREGGEGADRGPSGGRTWDGRAQTAHDQAVLPLLSPFEMANGSAQAVAALVRRAPYAASFRRVFGEGVFADCALTFNGVLLALETYQQNPAEFYPYSSKYDAYLRREAALSADELRGLAAFNDPRRGNCARCHPSGVRNGAFPQFTDYGYAAIGVPRNPAIPANADAEFHDLGLCGPLRSDLADHSQYCGLFRTPTLRNAATRRVFFHNGAFRSLEDVVRFYAQRDTRPQAWYPAAANGEILKFDDLPAPFRANIDRQPPLDRRAGDRSALTEQDIRDIVAFLNTLTDGYAPSRGGGRR